jgi:hypothetical protein
MINQLAHSIEQFISSSKDGFYGGAPAVPNRTAGALALLLAIIVVYVVLAIFGKFLWNNFLLKYLTILKPIESWIDIIAISILLRLLFA